jgi:hypothetical protein
VSDQYLNDLLREFDSQQRLVNAIRLLVKERDAARQEVCNMMHKTGFLRGDYADSRGWDCFKEEGK